MLATSRASLRKLWMTVALFLLLTPLGILAAGKAWGEWSPSAFSSPEGRAKIAASSQNQPAPDAAPSGLQRLSTVWTAPIPSYAPPFVKSARFGYLLSAMFGVGLRDGCCHAGASRAFCNARSTGQPRMSREQRFASTLLGLTRALSRALVSEQWPASRVCCSALDPRVRVAGLLSLVIAVTLSHASRRCCALCGCGAARSRVASQPFDAWPRASGSSSSHSRA